MSSFLDRLGARHIDALAIRPRAVSPFESVSSSAPFIDAAAHDGTARDATAPDATARDATARDATAGVSVHNTLQPDPQPRGMAPTDARGAHVDAWRARVVTPIPMVEATDPDVHGRLDTVRPRAESADRASALSASTPSVTVTSELRPKTTSPVRGTLSATPIAPAPTTSVRGDGAVVAPRSRTQLPTDVSDALAQISAPVVREPDVIRVHIGRVEVRAILPTARPTPRQSTSAAEPRPMTLDRYLGHKDRT